MCLVGSRLALPPQDLPPALVVASHRSRCIPSPRPPDPLPFLCSGHTISVEPHTSLLQTLATAASSSSSCKQRDVFPLLLLLLAGDDSSLVYLPPRPQNHPPAAPNPSGQGPIRASPARNPRDSRRISSGLVRMMMGFMGKRKELQQVVDGLCDFSRALSLLELPSRVPCLRASDCASSRCFSVVHARTCRFRLGNFFSISAGWFK